MKQIRIAATVFPLTVAGLVLAQAPPEYVIRTVVGSGTTQIVPGKDLDVVAGLEANLTEPTGVVLDAAGRVYFTDRNMVRRYDPATGLVTRIAGQFATPSLADSFGGDGGPAGLSKFFIASGIAFDSEQRLLVADTFNHRIRRITNLGTATPLIETFAGNGVAEDRGNGGPLARASFRAPTAVGVSSDGTTYISSAIGLRLRTIEPDGNLGPGWGPESDSCELEDLVCGVSTIAVDRNGNPLIAEAAAQVYSIQPDRKFILVAGKERFQLGFAGDEGPAVAATFRGIRGMSADRLGSIYIADTGNHRIRQISPDGIIRTIAGSGRAGTVAGLASLVGEGGLARGADLWNPRGIAVAPTGRIYFADSSNRRIRALIPCESGLREAIPTFDSLGGEFELEVSSNDPACPWTGSADSVWLSIDAPGSGVGSGKLRIRIEPNTTNAARSGTIRIANRTFAITQLKTGEAFPRIAAIANGASFRSGLVAGAWFVVTGTNLAQSTRSWTDADFTGNKLPTSLDGTSIKVGGRDAYPYFISPTQINALAPGLVSNGTVTIEVTNRFGKSTAPATVKPLDPAFFLLGSPVNGQSLAAAVHPDGTLVGEPGVIAGAATRPASPGASIILFGTAFGPASPAIGDGVTGFPAVPLANGLTLFMGGQRATVDFAGMVGPGLVQVNCRVPDSLPPGRHPVVALIGGVESGESAVIAVD